MLKKKANINTLKPFRGETIPNSPTKSPQEPAQKRKAVLSSLTKSPKETICINDSETDVNTGSLDVDDITC